MSENASNKLGKKLFNTSVPLQPGSVESDSDRLTEDLLSDIEGILEEDSHLSTEPVQPEDISPQSIVAQPISQPTAQRKSGQLVRQLGEKNVSKNLKKPNPQESKLSPSNENLGFGHYLDKILFAIACVYLLGVISWLVSHQKLKLPFVFQPLDESVAQENPLSQSDAQFISYMRRSLEAIDRKAQASKQETIAAPVQSADNLLSVPIPDNIPVYPPSQPPTAAAPSTALTPLPPPPSSQATAPLPTASVLEAKADLAPSPAPSPPAGHTLVGLLELGDRSAALFDFNGVTQRTQVGEEISTSGWTLVSVNNQKVVIRRNGEVRSIYVGQKF